MSSSTDKRWNPWLIAGFSATVAGVILMDVVLLFALGNLCSLTDFNSTVLLYGIGLGAILISFGILCKRHKTRQATPGASVDS